MLASFAAVNCSLLCVRDELGLSRNEEEGLYEQQNQNGKEEDGTSENRSRRSIEGDSGGGLFFKAATFAFQGGLEVEASTIAFG